MKIISLLLDVVETPWLEEHKRGIIILSILAFIAIGALVGIFIYRRKRKTKNDV